MNNFDRIFEAINGLTGSVETLTKKVDSIESKLKFQEADVDIVVHALQELLIEMQMPGTAEKIKNRADRHKQGLDVQ